jgi:hypothetical protein
METQPFRGEEDPVLLTEPNSPTGTPVAVVVPLDPDFDNNVKPNVPGVKVDVVTEVHNVIIKK